MHHLVDNMTLIRRLRMVSTWFIRPVKRCTVAYRRYDALPYQRARLVPNSSSVDGMFVNVQSETCAAAWAIDNAVGCVYSSSVSEAMRAVFGAARRGDANGQRDCVGATASERAAQLRRRRLLQLRLSCASVVVIVVVIIIIIIRATSCRVPPTD